MMYLNHKKGDVTEGLTFVVIIFFLAVSLLVSGFVITKIKLAVEDTALSNSTSAPDIIDGLDNLSTTGVQRAFVFLFAFLIVAMMMTAFLVRVHPAWLFLYVIFMAISVILAVLVSNTYSALINTEALRDYAATQTQITWVMTHSVKIVIGAVALSLIILFAKPPAGGVSQV